MSLRHPGLIVPLIALLGGLLYLLLGSDPAPDPEGRSETPVLGVTPAEDAMAGAPAWEPQADPADRQPGSSVAREQVPGRERYRLRGEVVRRGETPLTGVEVVAYAGLPSDRRLSMTSLFAAFDRKGGSRFTPELLGKKKGDEIARATVADDGSFTFEGLETRHLRLAIDHHFYALAQLAVVHVDPSRESVVLLRPYVGGHIVGRIRPYERPAIANAAPEKVGLIAEIDPMHMIQNPQEFMGLMMHAISRSADVVPDGLAGTGLGRFEFRAVLPSTGIHVRYRGVKLAGMLGPIAIAPGQKRELVLRTVDSGAMLVRVVGPTTEGESGPVEQARVRLTPAGSRGVNYDARAGTSEATGADGACRISGLLPGTYRVEVTADGFVAAHRDVAIVGGETDEITLALHRGGQVHGTIVDPSGEPIADAGVQYIQSLEVPILGDLTDITGEDLLSAEARYSRQRSDAQGNFALQGIDDDEPFVVVAWHEDYNGGFARGIRKGDTDVVIRLERPASIRGRVVDDVSGKPLSDFTIESLVRFALIMERPSRTATVRDSENGIFELAQVSAGTVTLRVQAEGYAESREKATIAAGATLDVGEIRMRRGGVIRGIVKTATGEPVPGVTVAQKAVGMLDNPLLQSMFGAASATTDKVGRFELLDLPPGAMRLKASSSTHASGVTKRLKLDSGDVIEGVEIILSAGGAIEGRLQLPTGMSVDGWMVMVSNNKGGSMRSSSLADDGGFRFEGVDPGKYDVQAMREDWMRSMQSEKMGMFQPGQKLDIGKLMQAAQEQLIRTRCRVKEGETTKVVLDGSDIGEVGVKVTFTVMLGDRRMKAGFLEVERTDGGHLTQAVIQSGTGTIDALQPGQYRLTLRTGFTMTPVGEPVVATIPVGKTHSVTVRLAGGSVDGRVIDEASGEALTQAIVRIVSAKGSQTDQIEEIGFAITNDEGEFHFDGLDDGRYSLFANDSFFNLSDKKHGGRLDNVRIAGGATVEKVVLRARRAARATVRVSDPADVPVPHTMVLAVDPIGKPLSILPTLTDRDGRATIAGLPPGAVRVVGMSSDLVPGYSEVQEIQTGRETDFTVAMSRGPRVRVRVEDRVGRPILGARLSARWKDGPWIPISLVQRLDSKTGFLDLGHLPAVVVEFRVHSASAKPFVVRRELPAGQSVELVFTAPK